MLKLKDVKGHLDEETVMELLCDVQCHPDNQKRCERELRKRVACHRKELKMLDEAGWFGRIHIERAKLIYEEMCERDYGSINSGSATTMMNAIKYLEKREEHLMEKLDEREGTV